MSSKTAANWGRIALLGSFLALLGAWCPKDISEVVKYIYDRD